MTCLAKHTAYDPPEVDLRCPKCDAECGVWFIASSGPTLLAACDKLHPEDELRWPRVCCPADAQEKPDSVPDVQGSRSRRQPEETPMNATTCSWCGMKTAYGPNPISGYYRCKSCGHSGRPERRGAALRRICEDKNEKDLLVLAHRWDNRSRAARTLRQKQAWFRASLAAAHMANALRDRMRGNPTRAADHQLAYGFMVRLFVEA